MKKDDNLRKYRDMPDEARREYDRWMSANAAIGTIVAVGLIAMALAGWMTPDTTKKAVVARDEVRVFSSASHDSALAATDTAAR